MGSEITFSNGVLNGGGFSALFAGLAASIPAAGGATSWFYFATDTGVIYQGTGTGWVVFNAGGGGGGAVNQVTAGASGNITVSPTVGNVVVDIVENPTFTNTVTANIGSLLDYAFKAIGDTYTAVGIFSNSATKGAQLNFGSASNSNSIWNIAKRDDAFGGSPVGCLWFYNNGIAGWIDPFFNWRFFGIATANQIISVLDGVFNGVSIGRGIGGDVDSTVVGRLNLKSGTSAILQTIFGESNLIALASGASNTAIGGGIGNFLTSGSNNVFLGWGLIASSLVTAINQAVILGGNSGVGANNGLTNIIVIGYNTNATASNQGTYGNAAFTEHIFPGGVIRNPGIPLYTAGSYMQMVYNSTNNQMETKDLPKVLVTNSVVGITTTTAFLIQVLSAGDKICRLAVQLEVTAVTGGSALLKYGYVSAATNVLNNFYCYQNGQAVGSFGQINTVIPGSYNIFGEFTVKGATTFTVVCEIAGTCTANASATLTQVG